MKWLKWIDVDNKQPLINKKFLSKWDEEENEEENPVLIFG